MVGVSNLPIEQEDLLLEILLDKVLRQRKFSEVLSSPKFLDRVPRTPRDRKKIANRRQYLLASPLGFKSAVDAYRLRHAVNIDPAGDPKHPHDDQSSTDQIAIHPTRLQFDGKDCQRMSLVPHQDDDYDMEIPLHWDPRYNVGAVQLYQGETVTRQHEVRKQIRFCIQVANAKDHDLYSARLASNRGGIILTEPIIPRHLRDISKLPRWEKIATAVKSEAKNENLARDISVKVQEINSLVPPVKKTLFRFPDGITCNNRAFNDNDNGDPPSDTLTLVKWPFMLPDRNLDLEGFPQKLVVDPISGKGARVPFDNLVPGFFWDMALDVAKVERTAHQSLMDPSALANRLQATLDLDAVFHHPSHNPIISESQMPASATVAGKQRIYMFKVRPQAKKDRDNLMKKIEQHRREAKVQWFRNRKRMSTVSGTQQTIVGRTEHSTGSGTEQSVVSEMDTELHSDHPVDIFLSQDELSL